MLCGSCPPRVLPGSCRGTSPRGSPPPSGGSLAGRSGLGVEVRGSPGTVWLPDEASDLQSHGPGLGGGQGLGSRQGQPHLVCYVGSLPGEWAQSRSVILVSRGRQGTCSRRKTDAGLGARGWPGNDRLCALHMPCGGGEQAGPDRGHLETPRRTRPTTLGCLGDSSEGGCGVQDTQSKGQGDQQRGCSKGHGKPTPHPEAPTVP